MDGALVLQKSVGVLPPVVTDFSKEGVADNSDLHNEVIRGILKKILPEGFFENSDCAQDLSECIQNFDSFIPLLTSTSSEGGNLSFYLLCRCRPNAFKFLFDMISRWLVPGKRLDVGLLFAADFRFEGYEEQVYTICEIRLHVESLEDRELIRQNLPVMEAEIRLGASSMVHAQRILDIKGLSSDEKTSAIQEQIFSLITHRPQDFDHDLIAEMQHFLVVCRDSFKSIRESRHMGRIICVHYLFRRALQESVIQAPEKRHLSLKFLRSRLHFPDGVKTVLGIVLGVNFLKSNELLEERHMLKAIESYLPDVCAVEGSYFSNTRRTDKIHTMYLEVSKRDNSEFSSEEISLLRKELPLDLKSRIEHLMHPIFMPQNEEEVMRNILSLSKELKYLRDIPQVMITFDEQSDHLISFTVILLRILPKKTVSIQTLFKNAGSFLKFVPDREKVVGFLRKKYPKQACVFRLQMDKAAFLRGDHSLDLYKARQVVGSEICRVIGEVRDYNGGMLSKQNELLCSLKDSLGGLAKQNEFLLENFFYSLTPVIMRTILEPEPLKTLFHMQLDALEEGFFTDGNYYLRMKKERGFVFVMITSVEPSFKETVQASVEDMNLTSLELASSFVYIQDTPCLGFIYRYESPERATFFEKAIRGALQLWEQKTFHRGGTCTDCRVKNEELLAPSLPF